MPIDLLPIFSALRRGCSDLSIVAVHVEIVVFGATLMSLLLLWGYGRIGRIKDSETAVGWLMLESSGGLGLGLRLCVALFWLGECGLEPVGLECFELVAETLPLLYGVILASIFAHPHGLRQCLVRSTVTVIIQEHSFQQNLLPILVVEIVQVGYGAAMSQ